MHTENELKLATRHSVPGKMSSRSSSSDEMHATDQTSMEVSTYELAFPTAHTKSTNLEFTTSIDGRIPRFQVPVKDVCLEIDCIPIHVETVIK